MICVNVREAPPPRPRGAGVLQPGRGREPISQGGGLTGFSAGTGVGSGLARRGGGDVLRRAPRMYDSDGGGGTGPGGGARLSELLPRFLRLSALVATELGEETGARTPVRPAPGWYMLLAGLLTRAALEGYLYAGWSGLKPVEVLLGVGLGFQEGEYAEEDDGELEPWLLPFEPEGMPRLRAALRVLFPVHASALSSSSSTPSNPDIVPREEDEDEASYAREMRARLARFIDVPSGTPDLSTHMEDLAWTFPAEPVERAALRFCESLSKWRGKPELETYRARPPSSANGPAPTPAPPADESVWRGIRRWFKIPPPSVMAERARANSANAQVLVPLAPRPPIPQLSTSSSGLTGAGVYGMMQSPGALHMQGSSPPYGLHHGDNPRKRAWETSGLQVPESVPPRQRSTLR